MNNELDFSPSLRPRAAGEVGAYVALEIRNGCSVWDALQKPFVDGRVDEYPFLLDDLAADPAVRLELAGPTPPAVIAHAPPVGVFV